MCGIAGIATTHPDDLLRPAVESMAISMKHRGPDSQGVQEFESCLLVNTRLSIIDLSDRGHMPMSSPGGQTCIIYNGQSYNAAEWRGELESRGHCFRTTSDTEVVLHLYQEYASAKWFSGATAWASNLSTSTGPATGSYLLLNSKGCWPQASCPVSLVPLDSARFFKLGHIPRLVRYLSVTPLASGHIGALERRAVENGAVPVAFTSFFANLLEQESGR